MNKYASKFGYIAAVAAFGIFAMASTAMAATTASFAPANVSVTTGQQFNVVISVDPAGVKNFAEKLEIDFPADLLQVSAFNLGSNWMALTQPGYDAADNATGVLIKTAGYVSGLSSQTPFGTITFTAKKSGNGNISIGTNSQAFLASGQTAITGNGASVVISTPAAVKTVTVKDAKLKTTNLAPVSTKKGSVVVPTTTQDVITGQAAAVVTASTSGSSTSSTTVIIVVIVAIIAAGVYWFTRKQS